MGRRDNANTRSWRVVIGVVVIGVVDIGVVVIGVVVIGPINNYY